MRNRLAAILMSGVAALGLGVVAAPAANAAVLMDQGQLSLACQYKNGSSAWYAVLDYPSQGGFGWRCHYRGAGYITGVDIEYYCWNVYGLHARGGSTAYNWRCDY